ncbi:MAG: hypothetical protein EOM52_04295 [Clostridia bacterium]|nr:hypothetical protein [Clostridia bacterium]
MEVCIKCVKCGDCSILREHEQLIVDCGSDNQSPPLSRRKFAYSAIHSDLGRTATSDILVSHFDADHFCGFLELEDPPLFAPIIRTAYLPWSIVDGKPIYVGALTRLLAVAPPDTYGLRLSKLTLELFARLDKVCKRVRFLHSGDTFRLDSESFRVLWPQIDRVPMVPPAPVMPVTSDSDADYELEYSARSLVPYGEVERDLEQQLSRILTRDECSNRAPMLGEDINRFSGALEEYLYLAHGGEDAEESRSALSRTLELALALDRAREALWSVLDRSSDAAKALASFALAQYHALVNCMNALSIVFDLPGRVLFPGDAPPEVIAYIAAHPTLSFQGPYRAVKLPHHGTEAYFCPQLPQAEQYIISNGGYQRRPVGRRFLDSLPHGEVYCTNAHRPPAGDDPYCTYLREESRCADCCRPVSTDQKTLHI